ncbi:MAG TPA: transglutaminase family protein [Aestuariivirgaceae bacterium]|nr:transglutaminase family protein [Aestuariivirgaceae bacterium]
MLIGIRHQTRYLYNRPVSYSLQRLHLTPSDTAAQKVMSWAIEAPGVEQALSYVDCFGNQTHLISQSGLHEEVRIIARGTVMTEDRAGVLPHVPGPVPDALYLRQTPATEANAAIVALTQALDGLAGLELLHGLMNLVRDRIDYETGVTHAHTTAGEALAGGRGVCQDHAHVFITAARHCGVPSRYVSGYLLLEGNDFAEAGHGWAESLVPGLGWVGFDCANRVCPTDRYVRLCAGLDARSVTPVAGTRRGGDSERLAVEVEVMEAQQQ